MMKTLSLFASRHPMPACVEGSVFGFEADPLDISTMAEQASVALNGVAELTLYVTGLTVALVEVIKYCDRNGVSLVLMHFDRNTGEYYPQPVFRFHACPFCGHPMRETEWHCTTCGAT